MGGLVSSLIELKEKQHEPKKFYECVLSLYRQQKIENLDTKDLCQVMVELHNRKKIDLCEQAIKAIEQGINVFQVINLLEDVIPHLNHDIETFLALLETFYEGSKNDLVAYLRYSSISKLVEYQYEFSRKVLEQLISTDRPFVAEYITEFFLRFSKGNEKIIHDELVMLKDHPSIYTTQGIIKALSILNYEQEENKKTLLVETFKVFNHIESRKLEGIDNWITAACGNLLDFDLAVDKLLGLAEQNSPEIDFALSRVLFLNTKKYADKDWFEPLLMTLSRTKHSHISIIENIDFVLAALVREKNNWALAERFFISWITQSDYRKVQDLERLDKLFDSTFHALTTDRNNLQKLVTRFFNHDSSKVHSAVGEIISYCNLHRIPALKFDKDELSKLGYQDVLFVGRKVLGYLIDCKTICSLTFSLLDCSTKNKRIQSLVYAIFNEHISHNYPGSTIEFLTEEVASTKSKIKKNLASEVIKNTEAYLKARDALPRIREIVPPSQQSRLVMREQYKVMNHSIEQARKGSITQLFTTIHLKHGSGSFSFANNDYRSPSKLSSYSSVMELPVSERNSPVSAFIETAGFRMVKRGD